MNFEHSPGLPGYGKRGLTGVDGLQGQSIYFTDYDPELNFIAIENAIRNNEVLWSTAPPGTKLPGGKKYMTGDLFISSFGAVYEIDAELDEFAITDGVLLKSQFFSTYHEYTSNGFKRWFNAHDASKFLIDNNLSELYYSLPNIYNIDANDYNRIEYTDGSAFTMYSTASIPSVDDQRALAIVKSSNGFRIGNKGPIIIRNINLTFDIAGIQKNYIFTSGTQDGTFISNKEINTNTLFDPLFDPALIDVSAVTTGGILRLYWNISQFASANGSAKIHIHKDVTVADITNTSVNSEFILHINDNVGNVAINGLDPSTIYHYYMSILVNGWERSGNKKSVNVPYGPLTAPVIFLISVIRDPLYPDQRARATWNVPQLATGGSGNYKYIEQSKSSAGGPWSDVIGGGGLPKEIDPLDTQITTWYDSVVPGTETKYRRIRLFDTVTLQNVYSNELAMTYPYP